MSCCHNEKSYWKYVGMTLESVAKMIGNTKQTDNSHDVMTLRGTVNILTKTYAQENSTLVLFNEVTYL